MLKLLHTGDLHLDSPFSRLDPGHAHIRRKELREAFSEMVQFVRAHFVDMLLIAGDLFDTEFVTRETVEFLRAEFARIPDCKVFITPGNHDPFTEDSVYNRYGFGDNVYVFPRSMLSHFYFENLNAYVYGYAFEQESLRHCPFAGYRVEDPGAYNVLLGHGDFAADTRYCPLSEERIVSFGADYAAFGHTHNAPDPITAGGVTYAHCGCAEGRGFDEVGEKGAIYVEIEKENGEAKVRTERVRFSRRRYEKLKVSVDGLSTLTAVEDAIRAAVAEGGYGVDTLLRITLTGRIAPSVILSEELLAAHVDSVFYAEVKDRTLPLYDVDYLNEDPSVKGVFFRMLRPALDSEDEEQRSLATKALRYGLAAITGEDLAELADEEGTEGL